MSDKHDSGKTGDSGAYHGKHRADDPTRGREATVTGDKSGYRITTGRTEQQQLGAGEAGEGSGR
jgi:hypothetical protein